MLPHSQAVFAQLAASHPQVPGIHFGIGCDHLLDGLGTIDELLHKLRGEPHGAISTRVVEALTTNETSFFRDVHPFEALRTQLVPELLKKRATEKTLNLWCAASSSGQEPYTIAMVLKDGFPELATWRVRFLATDISQEMLRRSREGVYSQLEVNRGLPAKYLVKYFDKRGADWQIKKELRDSIEFSELNLARPFPAMPLLDIVFIRNVLIYFNQETKRDILRRVRRVLAPDGALFVGSSESPVHFDDGFDPVTFEKSVYFRMREPAPLFSIPPVTSPRSGGGL